MSEAFRILLIEDSPVDAHVATEMLQRASPPSFMPLVASNLQAGIAQLRAGPVHAVVLDLDLPDAQGLETFLRVHAEFPEIPIVILTSTENEALAIQAVHDGAQDYLFKREVDMDSLVRALRYSIERHSRRQVEASLRATDAEFQAARQVQRGLFPTSLPVVEGFDLGGTWYPAQAVCGDYFDFMPMRQGYWGIAVGDVCGHGLGPALVMAETRACLRTLALTHVDPGEMLTIANRLLADDLAGDRFLTLFFARLDPAAKSISYAAAGHRGFLIDERGGVQILESTNVPLGLDRDTIMTCAPAVRLARGDCLLIVTDGIEEASSVAGQAFGTDLLVAAVHEHQSEPAQRIVERIIHEMLPAFTQGKPQDDDYTAVLLKVD